MESEYEKIADALIEHMQAELPSITAEQLIEGMERVVAMVDDPDFRSYLQATRVQRRRRVMTSV